MSRNTEENTHLTFPKFEDIKVSTKTFTTTTNLDIQIGELFKILPITEYVVVPKKRGRKKKSEQQDPNKHIEPGSIITIKHEDNIRGVDLKPKKIEQGKRRKWFRNSITIVIILDKPVNFKVCRNGTFQMTGCKCQEHAQLCVKYIWDYMRHHKNIYKFTRGDKLEALFIPSMRNIDFSLGFIVDREKLNRYICSRKDFHCLLETSFGYTGVNIKIPLDKDISTMKIKKIIFDLEGNSEKINTTYTEYLNLLSCKDRENKLNDTRNNTFLVFHSGKVIMSGLTSYFMKDTYYRFLDIIRDAYDSIEERLDVYSDEEDLDLQAEMLLYG